MATKKKAKAKKRKGGGSKLARTEIVQVRLDPKLKYAAELAAKKHRRTLSSFIEWAVEESISKVTVGLNDNETAKFVMNDVWDAHEAGRFIRLAYKYPFLLTHDEEILFKGLKTFDFIWMMKRENKKHEGMTLKNHKSLSFYKLEKIWPDFKQILIDEDYIELDSIQKMADKAEWELNQRLDIRQQRGISDIHDEGIHKTFCFPRRLH